MLKLLYSSQKRTIKSLIFALCFLTPQSIIYSQTADISFGCVPLQVNFTAPAGSPTYYWDFKDGASSNLQNPTNTFASAGSYTVEFRETTTGPVIGTVSIVVFDKPIPTLVSNVPNKGCVPLNVDFTANVSLPPGVSVTDYSWTYGQGSGGSGQNVNFTYSAVGSYTVTIQITASTPSCNNTISFVDYVGVSNPVPNIVTDPNPAMSCTAPLNVTFTDGSTSALPLTYQWDFGNGNTSTVKNPPAQTYSTDGDYTASLIITDTNNCAKTTTTTITIGTPTASFTSPDIVCINTPVAFTNTSSSGFYNWNFGSSAVPSSTGANSPIVTFTAAGTYTVDLTVMGPGGLCSDQASKVITVEDPVLTVTSTPKPQCDDDPTFTYTVNTTATIVSYNWTFDDGIVETVANPVHTYNIPDTIYARRNIRKVLTGTLTAVTSGGCVITETFVDTVFLVYARFMPDKYQGCAPLTVTFSDSSNSVFDIVNYEYRYGDGTTTNFPINTLTNTHTFTTPGIYPVVMTATNSLGCTDISDTIFIQVGEVLPLDFTANPSSICPGESITFTNTSANQSLFDGWNYSTDGELLSNCFGDPNGTFVFDDSVGVFDVTLSAYHNGCLSTQTKSNFITVKGPLAKFHWLYDCANPMDIQLFNRSNGFTDVLWDFGDGNTSTALDPVHTYAATGDYKITLTANNGTTGCPASIDIDTISIRKIEAKFLSDPLYCGGVAYPFDASASVDVNAVCDRGYKWIFSDPNIRPITSDNPQEPITFNLSGLQSLSLVVTDVNGCTDTLENSFTVFNVRPNFDVLDNLICTPDTVLFESTSTADAAIASWHWDFGDGGTSDSEDTTYIYQNMAAGGVNVILTVTDVNGCTEDFARAMFFYVPTSTITAIPSSGHACTDTPISFSATDFTAQGSNLTFDWTFGDGASGTGQNVTHSYSSGITTNVTLDFEEIASGCKGTSTFSVDIQEYPVVTFTSDADNLVGLCSPQIIGFTNTTVSTSPIVSTNWVFSNGLTASSSSPVFVFDEGSYTVQLIAATSYGCSDTLTKNFVVINPSADFTLDQNNICKGDEIVFTILDTNDVSGFIWDFGDGTSFTDQSPINHQYNFLPPSGQTVAKLTVYGAGGVCPYTIEKPVFIHEVRALFDRNDELDTVLCMGELLNLTNNSLNSDGFQWTFGDGTSSATSALNFTHSYALPDTFEITLMVSNSTFGCKDTISKLVIMNDRPVINAIGDTVCIGALAQLDVAGKQDWYKYAWTPIAPLSDPAIANPTADLTTSTDFAVVVTDTITTCPSSDTARVVVIQALEDVYFDTTVVMGDIVTLPIDNPDGAILFTWTPDTALSCLSCAFPTHQGINEITYTLSMTDLLGCSTAEGTFIIHIFPETFLDLPTTFTPNGDGVNDIIYLKGWGIKELEYFKIFNRWGELVFETNDIMVGWDGYYKGILQNNDTYTYKAIVKTWKNEEIEGAGHINLMR